MNWIIIGIICVSVAVVLIWPVCVVIPEDSLYNFNAPIENRTEERGMIWKTWQKKNGNWYQCKSRFERLGFN